MKLTDPLIKSLKPTDKPQKIADGNGLTLIIQPNGSKLWRYRYRYGGLEKLLSIGKYPLITLKEARQARETAAAQLAQGIDPAQAKREAKAMQSLAIENSFEAVALEWFNHWKIGKSDHHTRDTWRRLNLDVFPLLAKKPMQSITTPLVVLMVKDIVKRGALDMAKRALQKTGQVFRYAMQHGVCESDPTASIRPSEVIPARQEENQLRVPIEELPQLLRDCDAYEGHRLTKIALKLIALTFVRTKELIQAEWCEFDFKAARWTIPAARMKKKTPHIVPLARQTLALLLELRNITGGGAVLFPCQNGGGRCMSNNTILFALYRMGYKGRMTGHGFRGVASTELNERAYEEQHIEIQLSHLTGSATKRAYDHAKHMPERTTMMQNWADFLDAQRRVGVESKIKLVK